MKYWEIAMLNKSIIDEIKIKFGDKEFTNKELYVFYQVDDPKLNESTFRWRIYNLKKKGIIQSVRNGVYIINDKKEYKPQINNDIKEIFQEIKTNFPYINISIWETKWLTNFIVHQTYKNIIIIEVDKEATSVIYSLIQNTKNDVYINPSKKEIEKYLNNKDNYFVIKTRITEAPIKKYDDITIPRIEKILVDLLADKELFNFLQGNELQNIFTNIMRDYTVNLSTLNRYSKRRNIKKELDFFIKKIETNESVG